MIEPVYDQRESSLEFGDWYKNSGLSLSPDHKIEKYWVRLLEWRNMSSEIFTHLAEMSKRFREQTGHELCMVTLNSGWSEIGYWKKL
jgi:hypothetical protein